MKTVDENMMQQLVERVISRLAPELGATGRRGDIVAVFSGATAGLASALAQVRWLILDGYRLHTAFSNAAADLYGKQAQDEWSGLPHIESIASDQWLQRLNGADGVIVPLLSVNTLSKIALLLADNLVSNIVLHALFMGKPVVAAVDGVDPRGPGRRRLGFNRGNPALQQALQTRLDHLVQYGCTLVPVSKIREVIRQRLTANGVDRKEPIFSGDPHPPSSLFLSCSVVSAAQVAHARRNGAGVLHIPENAVVTPLARETAVRQGIRFSRINRSPKAP